MVLTRGVVAGMVPVVVVKGLSASAPPDAPHIAPRVLIRDNELLNEQVREMSGVCL